MAVLNLDTLEADPNADPIQPIKTSQDRGRVFNLDTLEVIQDADPRGGIATALPVQQPQIQPQQQAIQQQQQQIGSLLGQEFGRPGVETAEDPRTQPTRAELELPELGAGGLLAGQDASVLATLTPLILTATNPEEIGQILSANVPAVGIQSDEQGNLIATNNETGARVILNRPGISQIDILQGLGLAAAFTPAGRATSLVGAGVKSALTEAAIQTGQVAAGGEFDVPEVAAAAVGGVAGQKISDIISPRGIPEVAPTTRARPEPVTEVSPKFSSVASSEQELTDVSTILSKGQIREAVEVADVDPRIIESAERLGIDIPSSSASQNRAFVEAAQAAKSQPQSKLSVEEAKAIQQTRDSTDEFIRELRGGDLSVSGFDDALGRGFTDQIGKLTESAKKAYNIVNRAIEKRTPVDLSESRAFMSARIDDLGGDKTLLEAPEKALLRLVERSEKGELVTYAALDRVRKSVGEGFNNQGVFKDSGDAILSEVYASLSKDQQKIAAQKGVGAAYTEARGLVSQRKDIEKAAVKLFGRDLDKSLLPKLEGAARALIKGNTRDFKKVIAKIPKEFRGDAAAIVLDNIFGSGARTATGLSEGFVNAFQKLNRNEGARDLLFTFLPKQSVKTFNDIGNVWTGLIRSKSLQNNSKTARDLLAALDNGSAASRMLGLGSKIAAAEGVGAGLFGVPLVGTTAVVVAALKTKGKTAIQKADDFLSSPQFAGAIRAAATGRKNIDQFLSKSQKFKEWLGTLPKSDRDTIASDGFVPWLSAPIGAAAAVTAQEQQ